jgi:hypothetical protein
MIYPSQELNDPGLYLESVIFEEGSQIEILNWRVFSSCRRLISIVIPESVKVIEDDCFERCYNLRIVTILSDKNEDNTIDISGNAFDGSAQEIIFTLRKVVYICA